MHLGIEVALAAAIEVWNAKAGQAEAAAVLCLRRDVEHHPASQRRHLDLTAEHGLSQRNRHIFVEVVTLTLESLVRVDRDDQIQVAACAAVAAGLTFACD